MKHRRSIRSKAVGGLTFVGLALYMLLGAPSVVAQSPTPSDTGATLARGYTLLDAQDPAAALQIGDDLRTTYQADPGSVEYAQATLLAGQALLAMERYPEAAARAEEAAQRFEARGLVTEQAQAFLLGARALLLLDQPEPALTRAEAAARLAATDAPALAAAAYRLVADIATLQDDAPTAVRALQDAVRAYDQALHAQPLPAPEVEATPRDAAPVTAAPTPAADDVAWWSWLVAAVGGLLAVGAVVVLIVGQRTHRAARLDLLERQREYVEDRAQWHKTRKEMSETVLVHRTEARRQRDLTEYLSTPRSAWHYEVLRRLQAHLPDHGLVDLQPHLQEVAASQVEQVVRPGLHVSLVVQLNGARADGATCCLIALFVAEAVRNAARHAFVGRTGGTIRVLGDTTSPFSLRLAVSDDGRGLPIDLHVDTLSTGGLSRMRELASLLGGSFGYDHSRESAFWLTVPIAPAT